MSHIGDMIFIDVEKAIFVGQIQSKHKFQSFTISPDGAVLSTILLTSKHIVHMFRIDSFFSVDDDSKESISPVVDEIHKSGIIGNIN